MDNSRPSSRASSTSSTCLELPGVEVSHPDPTNDTTEDRTTEETLLSLPSDASSPESLDLKDAQTAIKPRSYQMEMVEESLLRNIIVAMDTGSGKTHIAVLRILHELDTIPEHQYIWFLAPTVSLCTQQFEYLQSQITSVLIKFLSGADAVDRWTEQSMWNAILKNVKVVVSTYQILLDALTHGFIKIESLALIVIDEAHNCVGKHPGAKLMQSFYHKRKGEGLDVPHILGLTASPLMRSDPASLDKIEETLDAICRTPRKHRAELRLQVKLPQLLQVYYSTNTLPELFGTSTKTLDSLREAQASLKLSEDPWVLRLIQNDSEKNRRLLAKTKLSQKTWCRDQIQTLYATALKMASELGAWAADYYIAEVVKNVQTRLIPEGEAISALWDISRAETQYIGNALAKVQVMQTGTNSPVLITDKVSKLIQTLIEEYAGNFSGIIFVQERAMVEVLARLLSLHPETKEKFRVGTMVGSSTNAHRSRNIAEFVDLEAQKHVLGHFRSGALNLVVATSVLEEGIDVPACNVVICFERPANLKSFVQRRGRARHRDSKLVLLLDSTQNQLGDYQALEETMKKIYEDEMRELSELIALEDGEETDNRTFRVASTGALLDLDNAVSHLHHFCATLPAAQYVDLRPDFVSSEEGELLRGKVTLPLSVHIDVRTAQSVALWQSEKNAFKDAAFQAYVALYEAGLVNDNLLPLMRHDEDAEELISSSVEKRASILTVSEQLNPWIAVSRAWNESAQQYCSTICVGGIPLSVQLPVSFSQIQPFQLYWDVNTEISVVPSKQSTSMIQDGSLNAVSETYALLKAAFGTRFSIQKKRHVMLFASRPDVSLKDKIGYLPLSNSQLLSASSLIRDSLNNNITYHFRELLEVKPPISKIQNPYDGYELSPDDSSYLSLKRLPKRYDFLHKVAPSNLPPSTKPYPTVLPASRCVVDKTPFPYMRIALLIPSIMHRYGIHLVAQELSNTILKDVGITDLGLVVTAICASSAMEATNYQRLEFLGDSILKLCASIQLMAEYPLWYEGLLSAKKDRLVSNSRLARAAIEIGLDRFIITKAFTGHKWRPMYVDDLVNMKQDGKRELSSKVVADVVESLTGAAMIDGGIPKALKCLNILVPDLDWKPLDERRSFLYHRAPDLELPPPLEPLEALAGYEFRKKALLIEAMTHASCNSGTGSLERFEFLGDAILDNIVVTAMFPNNLTHFQMHLLRTALVNADFLAFICMEWSIDQETTSLEEVKGDGSSSPTYKEKTVTVSYPLWKFMRHSSPILGREQFRTAKRHQELRFQIKEAISTGTHFPWPLLARLQAPKFFSDLVESLFGAVWIDSGSLETCTQLAERMGILKYFRRILKDDVRIMHPKEELGILADTEKVKYAVSNRMSKGEHGESVEFLCEVQVGGRVVVRVEGGVNKDEVRTTAAEEAVRVLQLRKEGGLTGEREDLEMGGMDGEMDGDDEDGGVKIGNDIMAVDE